MVDHVTWDKNSLITYISHTGRRKSKVLGADTDLNIGHSQRQIIKEKGHVLLSLDGWMNVRTVFTVIEQSFR